jgi:hypothetical protein
MSSAASMDGLRLLRETLGGMGVETPICVIGVSMVAHQEQPLSYLPTVKARAVLPPIQTPKSEVSAELARQVI